uniref:C2H2-type domain-containing protein n=1 Tax=viral metagenome TaxID=1070528 RepID=A0A6M3L3C6_9ZZZZ
MRTKKVNRYYCEFCPKAGCSASHMARHERGCTKNPNRICRVCGLLEQEQPDLTLLVAMWPDISQMVTNGIFNAEAHQIVGATLPAVREAAGNCPACIMASLRQADIPVPFVYGFNWTTEMDGVWREFNASRTESY